MALERIITAMSGGVDSSVAAALLVEKGYEVIGVMLRLWSAEDEGPSPANRCCALEAQYDAERVADVLSIPFYLINVADQFKQRVVDYFIKEYAAGRTPNPCVECNRHIRFDLLLRRALMLDAEYLATGHYARVQLRNGGHQLLRAVDPEKDQSYVLHMLGQRQLARVMFPIGELKKSRVREIAQQFDLPVARRQDSQDLCFVGEAGYRSFLAAQLSQSVRPGPIRDTSGRVLGEHRGLVNYTIGQRKGINVGSTERLYVLELDPAENAVTVGAADELGRDSCFARQISWVQGKAPADRFEATAKIRYKASDTPVVVKMLDDWTARVDFEIPQRDITPGQALVFYQDEVVLGGGSISWEN